MKEKLYNPSFFPSFKQKKDIFKKEILRKAVLKTSKQTKKYMFYIDDSIII